MKDAPWAKLKITGPPLQAEKDTHVNSSQVTSSRTLHVKYQGHSDGNTIQQVQGHLHVNISRTQ